MSDEQAPVAPYFIEEAQFPAFLSELDRGPLYGTVAESHEARAHFERVSQGRAAAVSLRCLPAVESAKVFLFPARERVAVYPGGPSEPDTGLSDDAPQTLVGVRACDLVAVEIMDLVLKEGDFTDPFYTQRRDHTLILSCDCVAPAPSCFCNLVGGKPYADGGFDLNFTPVRGGYVVAIGSQAGKELVLEQSQRFREAAPAQLQERDQVRADCMKKLQEQNARYEPKTPIEQALTQGDVARKWLKLAAACVECGGCTYACPTCHCFLLFDQVMQGKVGLNERFKAWDSCLFGSYAKMAGIPSAGKPTPRPELPRRFENRVRHKFEWMRQNLGRIGCVGCGRCEEVCLGGLDIREVIKEIGG